MERESTAHAIAFLFCFTNDYTTVSRSSKWSPSSDGNMPIANNFRHQEYTAENRSARTEWLSPRLPAQPGSEEFADCLARVGRRFEEIGVGRIGLMHGTFVGNDAFGLIREIGRFAPGLSERMQQNRKLVSDKLIGESGNFTPDFSKFFDDQLNRETSRRIDVRTIDWSSENNHTGRVDGAIHLLGFLLETPKSSPRDRTLLWGHSHAGNVFALLSNLIAADAPTRAKFLEVVRRVSAETEGDREERPALRFVEERLDEVGRDELKIDFVTFGTPVRYGWDSACIRSLTHFMHHLPEKDLARDRVPFPPSVDDIVTCKHGDFVQQVGIAGTDFLPFLLNRCTRTAERTLHELLEPGIRRRDLLKRLEYGQRVHDEGTNLLVDYSDCDPPLRQALLGHGIYTRREWLVFHAEEIANRLPP